MIDRRTGPVRFAGRPEGERSSPLREPRRNRVIHSLCMRAAAPPFEQERSHVQKVNPPMASWPRVATAQRAGRDCSGGYSQSEKCGLGVDDM